MSVLVATTITAQSAPARTARHRMEVGLGVINGVPPIDRAGRGSVLTVMSRRPAQSGAAGVLIGAAYSAVRRGYRGTDSEFKTRVAAAALFLVGTEWVVYPNTRLELLWTPAIAGERHWDSATDTSSASAPWRHTWSAGSAGVRWGRAESRFGYVLRLHGAVSPRRFGSSGYPSFQVVVRL